MTSSNGNIFRVTGLCVGNWPVSGEFPAQRPVTHSFDVFFGLRLIKRLSKHSRGWWFETRSHPLWRHYNGYSAYTAPSKCLASLWLAGQFVVIPLLRCSFPLQWRHNGRDRVSNHQPHDCFLNHLFRHRSKKTSKLRVTGLCVGNSPEAGEFPAQMASNAENVPIWWRHHASRILPGLC